jgi:uncharacterized membrane protein
MIAIPSPLHPAIVHFPIVLILLGAMGTVVAVFVQRRHLSWMTAALLTAGALGAAVATWSGEREQEMAGELSARAEQILDQHEDWGEATRNSAILAAFLACGAAAAARFPRASRGVAAGAALAAISSSYCVAQAGHYGGQLVYKHGTGVNTLAGSAANAGEQIQKKAHHDDD